MEEKVFWELLGAACRMGRFVAAVPNAAASANIVGKLEVGKDGGETVLQRRKRPSAHVHFRPEAIAEFAFTFVDPGFGAQPCLELRTREGAPALRLYYQGKKAARRFEEFRERAGAHAEYVTGSWLAPAAAANEGIFVGGGDGGDGAAVESGVKVHDEFSEVNQSAGRAAGGDAGAFGGVAEVDEDDAGRRVEASAAEGGAAEVVNAS